MQFLSGVSEVFIVILNDPGRLISVHMMHSGFAAGWSSVILLYELITVDPTDSVYNPIWRQGCCVIPFISRISVIRSLYSWSLGIKLLSSIFLWCHIIKTWPILIWPGNADGLFRNWLVHGSFEIGTLSLGIWRMQAFFGGTLRADIAFRRGSSSLSIEESDVVQLFSGGILNAR